VSRLRRHQRGAGRPRRVAGRWRRSPAPAGRCGIDTVEIARIERLLAENAGRGPAKLFSDVELDESGEWTGSRREPRRALRREGGVRQALPARGGARRHRAARTSRSRATTTARPRVVADRGPKRCWVVIASLRSRCR
jgi:hypothetical protein